MFAIIKRKQKQSKVNDLSIKQFWSRSGLAYAMLAVGPMLIFSKVYVNTFNKHENKSKNDLKCQTVYPGSGVVLDCIDS